LYGDQVFVVEDRLNSRYGCNMIDVWMPDYNEAIQFGHKFTTVNVL
jgi:3D (Asp-Asp-Asp) domain-containing protein